MMSRTYVTVQDLAQEFNVSRRTIYNSLSKINHWLREDGYSEISQIRGRGLYLDKNIKSRLGTELTVSDRPYYEYSPGERKAWIFIFMTIQEQPLILKDFIEQFDVSRNTVLEDIRTLKTELKKHQLMIGSGHNTGYHVKGEESDVRTMLIHYLMSLTPDSGAYQIIADLERADQEKQKLPKPYRIFIVKELRLLKKLLIEYEQELQIEFTDEVLNNFVVWYYLFLKRIQQKKYICIDPIEKEVIQSTDAFEGAKTLCSQLSTLKSIEIPTDEIYYITKYLLSAKVNYDLNPMQENEEMKQLLNVVENMMIDFQQYGAITFTQKDKIAKNLLIHLKPAYYRIKYGIQVENILLDSIKRNYPEVFHLTKKIIHHFENLVNHQLNDNEIAYISMHFGGWLRKEGITLGIVRKRLLIVCTSGLGTGRILETQLVELFSGVEIIGVISLREYKKRTIDADFIVSTVSLPDKDIPIFITKPILDDNDKEQLLRKVNSFNDDPKVEQLYSVDTLIDLTRRYVEIIDEEGLRNEFKRYLQAPIAINQGRNIPSLADLLVTDKIFFSEQVKDWKEAIQQASIPLLKNENINQSYVQQMIDQVTQLGPYMVISKEFALPHAAPEDGVIQTGMSMLVLDRPVDLLGNDVRIIVVLATQDNEQHLKALGQLTKFVNEGRKEILATKNKEKIIKLIQKYSQE